MRDALKAARKEVRKTEAFHAVKEARKERKALALALDAARANLASGLANGAK
jgi:hypothetical protein